MKSPRQIEFNARALTLHWDDGPAQRIASRVLRMRCPCAECRWLRLDGNAPVVPPDIAILEIRPAGYGMQLVFSDKHERGIFPWAYVEQLSAQLPAPLPHSAAPHGPFRTVSKSV
ncbi:DUF971 domain-containing protein [Paraburkholderia diazotrophica]|uniref:DUF971 family protein n=1 Tax=Paraburkholderia diazotrophica TaxID=667676 RepID=A0A1H7BUL5_9BURK|nr:DUF971 domain-containing protein [Paraburkholderia diazotrophica]SEJ80886.1 DUF971 family protein [Paraburkholderia diazotrophica]